MDLILKYFPNLTQVQKERFAQLKPIYEYWNAQINVISRKDLDNFYERHVLHSLGIAKIEEFAPGTRMLDVGTGGGFPGIPLAILLPECSFHLVDSVGNKIKVVNEVAAALKLQNLSAEHGRAEEMRGQFDYIICRAVTRLNRLLSWVQDKVAKPGKNSLQNGLICLKGGDLDEELNEVSSYSHVYNLSDFFTEPFFETKKVVHVPLP